VISEELPPSAEGAHLSNSDPITGQAAWYDVRVRVYKADQSDEAVSFPQFDAVRPAPGQEKRVSWLSYFAGKRRSA